MKRQELLNALVTHLSSIVITKVGFEESPSYPHIYILPPEEEIVYQYDGHRFHEVRVDIRGAVHSQDNEKNTTHPFSNSQTFLDILNRGDEGDEANLIDQQNKLIWEVEKKLYVFSHPDLINLEINSIQTDEGIFEPEGYFMIRCTVTYTAKEY